MVNMFEIYEELSRSFGEDGAKVLTRILSRIHQDMLQTVTKVEFNELKDIVTELAEAQKKTEQRLEELAEAQKKTEQRVEELAEAQKKTEQRLEELAEAQKRTEQRLDSLARRFEELAEAQKQTHETLTALIKRVDSIEVRLEGLSNSVGYSLEDRAYKSLPNLLADYGVKVEGRLLRRYIGEYQVNIFGRGILNEESITIIGECKVRPSRKEVDRFIKVVDRLEKSGMIEKPFMLFVANDYHPKVEEYLREKKIPYFWSYEF